MNAKAIRIRKFDGESYRCMGSSGIGGINLMLEFRTEGIDSGVARLDGFFRRHLGDLTRDRRTAIKRTMPKEVSLFTRTHRDPYGKTSTLYVVRKSIMEAWLARVREVLAQSTQPDLR
ncbi:MAG: hypothetical protein Q8P21_01040 [bacterium]|nr:hypothetical protein [bacterium]